MALFFFHLRDGTDVLIDPEGLDLEGPSAIAEAAFMTARSIISHDALSGVIKLDYRIEVEDCSGDVVHTLEFRDAIVID